MDCCICRCRKCSTTSIDMILGWRTNRFLLCRSKGAWFYYENNRGNGGQFSKVDQEEWNKQKKEGFKAGGKTE
jgi:hypothetical protein